MRRVMVAVVVLLASLAIFGAAPGVAQAASCSDSWASDGHGAPWWTSPSGGTLHGNAVHITCPSSSTYWQVDYFVWKQPKDFSTLFFPINVQNKTGHGSTTFSFTRNPIGCNTGWLYGTQVHNDVTGGDIAKPNDLGYVIC